MLSLATHRPRNVDTLRASSILYGDLGTSKAYVIGLAFALAGYASFWLIAAVSILTVLIGINYITICKYYPNGGGVYASVRKRSEMISLIGAFFLIADYLVTAALSALSAFNYFGVGDPVLYSACFIALIGGLNYFGPRHTGTLAFFVAIAAVVVLIILAIFCIPQLPLAWTHIQPLPKDPWLVWRHFVGVIVALSGIEAIANATGVMKLNKGSSENNPIVTRTSTPAIVVVIIEVAILTSLFAFAANAIGNFQIAYGTVNAPGEPNVRDYMLKYMGQVFVGNFFGETIGLWFGIVVSAVMGVLLLSAVNTAMTGLIALQYLMASDGEVPSYFQRLNRYGVPLIPLLVAALVPVVLVLAVRDVAGLAALYAIGFVGAIATNLGSTSTDFSLPLSKPERGFMFFAFLLMTAIEITLFIDKPQARVYGLAVIVIGLILRGLSRERKLRRIERVRTIATPPTEQISTVIPPTPAVPSILCPVKKKGKALKVALEKSTSFNYPLYILFIREQEVISEEDLHKTWQDDDEAIDLLNYAKSKGKAELIHFYYVTSDSPADIIVAYALRLDAKQIIIDRSRHGTVFQLIRGNMVKRMRKMLPEEFYISTIS